MYKMTLPEFIGKYKIPIHVVYAFSLKKQNEKHFIIKNEHLQIIDHIDLRNVLLPIFHQKSLKSIHRSLNLIMKSSASMKTHDIINTIQNNLMELEKSLKDDNLEIKELSKCAKK